MRTNSVKRWQNIPRNRESLGIWQSFGRLSAVSKMTTIAINKWLAKERSIDPQIANHHISKASAHHFMQRGWAQGIQETEMPLWGAISILASCSSAEMVTLLSRRPSLSCLLSRRSLCSLPSIPNSTASRPVEAPMLSWLSLRSILMAWGSSGCSFTKLCKMHTVVNNLMSTATYYVDNVVTRPVWKLSTGAPVQTVKQTLSLRVETLTEFWQRLWAGSSPSSSKLRIH